MATPLPSDLPRREHEASDSTRQEPKSDDLLSLGEENLSAEPSEEYLRRQGLPVLWREHLRANHRVRPPEEPVLDIPLRLISTSGIENVRTAENEEKFRALVLSMQQNGLIHPVVVAKHPNRPGHYFLLCGSRRFRAAAELGWPAIRASVREIKSVAEAHVLNIVENLDRSDITSYELAVACERMTRQFRMSPSQLAKAIGYSLSHVQNLVRLLTTLPSPILEDWKAAHPLLSCKRLERLAHDPDAVTKWQAARSKYTREEGARPLTLEEQLEDTASEDDDPTGWQPYKRPTKAAILRLRDVLARQTLPEDPRKVREMMVGICDYVRGARADVPHAIAPPPRRRRTGGRSRRIV